MNELIKNCDSWDFGVTGIDASLFDWQIDGVTTANSKNGDFQVTWAVDNTVVPATISLAMASDPPYGFHSVATGVRSEDGTITLAEVNGSGISGTLEFVNNCIGKCSGNYRLYCRT